MGKFEDDMNAERVANGLLASDFIYPSNFTNLGVLVGIRKEIDDKLQGRPGYGGIGFCDVSAYGIQIDVRHKRFDMTEYVNFTLRYQAAGHKNQTTPDFLTGWRQPSYDAAGIVSAVIDWWETRGEKLSNDEPCDHEFKEAGSGRCYKRYVCSKCNKESGVDSSDCHTFSGGNS